MAHVTRRAVLAHTAGLAASALLPSTLRAKAAADLVAPAPLPVRRIEPGVVEVELTAGVADLPVAGQPAPLWTYNGRFPGPLLRVREGDTVRVRFANALGEPTNLHYHGLHIPPTGRADNVWLKIPPGERFTYEFTVPRGDAGLHWYHPHVHGRTAGQLFKGLAGPIVVEGEVDALPELAGADERVLVLRDLELGPHGPTGHGVIDWVGGKQGDLVLVNGQARPILRARRPMLRLRLVNAANARYFRLRLDDHVLHVIGIDGRFLERPAEFEEYLLVPGARVDLLVRPERTGRFGLVDLGYDRRGRSSQSPQPILTVEVPDHLGPPSPLPQRLGAVMDLSTAEPAVRRRIVMSLFYLNGRAFDPRRVDVSGRLGDVEHWEVVNAGQRDHPFHLHTWYFQVLERNGRPEPFRALRDTVNMPPGGRVRLAVPLHNHTGRTVYHCHIAEHSDMNMMGQIEVTA